METAYVYNGGAACSDGCSSAYIQLLESAGITVVNKDSDPKDELEGWELDDVDLYVQPGGNSDIDSDWAICGGQVNYIRSFVQDGGNYLGSCTGCWMATKNYYSLVPYLAGYYVSLHNQHSSIKVNDVDNHIIPIKWRKEGENLFSTRNILYAGGPYLVNAEDAVGYFEEGVAAAIVESFGKGKVAICGAHPEATADWYQQAPEDWDGSLCLDLGLDLINRLRA